MNFYKDLGEDSVPEEEAGRESIAEGSGQSDNETLPERAGGIEDSPQGNKIEEIDLSDEEEALKPELKKLGHYFDVNGGRHIVPAEEAERRQNLEDLKEKNIVGAWGGASYLEERNRLLHPSLDIPKPNFLPVEDKVEGKLAEAFEGKLREERNTAVRRAFGDHVSPEEMERIATSKLPIEPVPLDSSSGKTAASLGENPPSYDSIGDFYTWLKGTGGRYGDLNDILSANYEQARRDYNDLISPEAKRAREKANESRKRLAVLGDIGLVLGDIVGAAAGGNVNRRDKTAQMVNAERELADEAMLQQRESALLQRYRQAADRGLANARHDYQTALQRYLKDQDNDIKRIQLGIQRDKLTNEQARWEKELGLKESAQVERKRHNEELEKIAQEKARQSGVRADAYASGINGLKRKYLDNSFGVETIDPDMNVSVSREAFGKYLGTMLGLTGGGYGSANNKGSILYDWDKLKTDSKIKEENNEGVWRAIDYLGQTSKVFKKEKTPTRQQIQNYVSALVGLYKEVTSERFMLKSKKGENLPDETAAFVSMVENNIIEVMRKIKEAEKENLDAYSKGLESLYMGIPDSGEETVDSAL